MARYSYQCPKCDYYREVVRSMFEDDLGQDCKFCEEPMNRVFTPPGVVFRGSGFYKTGG
jgi:putative FmdB family regulatory protein